MDLDSDLKFFDDLFFLKLMRTSLKIIIYFINIISISI